MEINLLFSGYRPILYWTYDDSSYILCEMTSYKGLYVTFKQIGGDGTEYQKYDDGVSIVDRFIIESLDELNIPYIIYNKNGIYMNKINFHGEGHIEGDIISPILDIEALPQYLDKKRTSKYDREIKYLIDRGLYQIMERSYGYMIIPSYGYDDMTFNQILPYVSLNGHNTIYGVSIYEIDIIREDKIGPVTIYETEDIITGGDLEVTITTNYNLFSTIRTCEQLNDTLGIFLSYEMEYKKAKI